MEISGDVTDAGRTDGQTREDSATQPMDAGWLSFAICLLFNTQRYVCLTFTQNVLKPVGYTHV